MGLVSLFEHLGRLCFGEEGEDLVPQSQKRNTSLYYIRARRICTVCLPSLLIVTRLPIDLTNSIAYERYVDPMSDDYYFEVKYPPYLFLSLNHKRS